MPIDNALTVARPSANTGALPGKLTPCDLVDLSDSFTLSLSQLISPVQYRAHAIAQMEVLRRANGYQFAAFSSPTRDIKTIPAYSQIEEQWSMTPGSFIWGWNFSVSTAMAGPGNFHVLLTDACTETALFSDYAAVGNIAGASTGPRWPFILANPRLISDPGKVNVEIYNNFGSVVTCQFVAFVAQPITTFLGK